MKNSLIILLLFLLPALAYAQINESDTLRFQARFGISGNAQTGNVEMFALRGKVDMLYAPAKKLVFKTQTSYMYQEFFHRKADEDVLSRNFAYWKPQARLYPYLMCFLSTNFRRNIDFRYFTGAGLTWQIVQKPKHNIKWSVMGVYEQSNFSKNTFNDLAYNGQNQIKIWRASTRIFGRHVLGNNKFILHYEAYIQPSFERSNNLRWQTEIGGDIPIYKGLNFTTNYVYTYEGVVTLGSKEEDSIFTVGLGFS